MAEEKIVYKCSVCGREVGREYLVVKRAVFREMGRGGRTLRTRNVGWLCTISDPETPDNKSCVQRDADFNLPLYSESPGQVNLLRGRGRNSA